MKVGILCREHCQITRNTVEAFAAAGMKIDLLLMETDIRKKRSAVEKDFLRNHEIHHRNLIKHKKGAAGLMAYRLYGMLPPSITRLRKKAKGKTPPPLSIVAAKHQIPLELVARHSSEEACQIVSKYNIDYMLLANTAWLIKKPLVDVVKVINGHNALLPTHRGLDSMQWSVLEGDPTGITAHLVDEGVDSGPILRFREVKPRKQDDMKTLRVYIFSHRPDLFVEVIKGLEEGTIQPQPQKKDEGTHHRPMTVEELWQAENKLNAITQSMN